MVVDGIDFNVDFAVKCEKKAWIDRHAGMFPTLSEDKRQKLLSGVYDRVTGSLTHGPSPKERGERDSGTFSKKSDTD